MISPRISQTPVHRLAELTPQDIRVTPSKLIAFYETHGQFPSQYRSLIWRYLLKLPENVNEFGALVRRGPHPAFESSTNTVDVKSREICSLLTRWSPVFAEIQYLPTIVESLLGVHDQNDLAVFETCVTLFMWWGYSWNVLLPNPPIHITSSIGSILQHFDAQLHEQLTTAGVDSGDLGWKILSTFFSQILPKDSWAVLIDYIFLHFKDAKLMVLVPVAILRHCRDGLLRANSGAAAAKFVSSEQNIRVADVISMVSAMSSTCPLGLYYAAVSACIEGGGGCDLEGKSTRATGRLNMSHLHIQSTTKRGSDKPSISEKKKMFDSMQGYDSSHPPSVDEQQRIIKSMSMHAGRAIFPLPSGSYPSYSGRPQTVTDWELQRRESVLALHREINGNSALLLQLRAKITEMEAKHAAWMQTMYAEKEAEMAQECEDMNAEEAEATALLAQEAAAARERLLSLQALERLADEERAVVDLLKAQTQKKERLRQEHQARMNHVSEQVARHRQAGKHVDAFLDNHFQELPLSLEEAQINESSNQRSSAMESEVSFTTARQQELSSRSKSTAANRTHSTKTASTNADSEGEEGEGELSFRTAHATLHSSGRVSAAVQTDDISTSPPRITPASTASEDIHTSTTAPEPLSELQGNSSQPHLQLSPATIARTVDEVMALLNSPVKESTPSHETRPQPRPDMRSPLAPPSRSKSVLMQSNDALASERKKVSFASPNRSSSKISPTNAQWKTPQTRNKENKKPTPTSNYIIYSAKSKSYPASLLKTPNSSSVLKQPPMRISTYARTPYSAASSRKTATPTAAYTPSVHSSYQQSISTSVASPVSESASAFVTAQKFPRLRRQQQDMYQSYVSYQDELADSTPVFAPVNDADLVVDSPELLHLSNWTASRYPHMPDTPALKAALADSEASLDSHQHPSDHLDHPSYSQHHSFAPPMASLTELDDDSNRDPDPEAEAEPETQTEEQRTVEEYEDDLDRVFEDVFETFIEGAEEEEEEVDSGDRYEFYDTFQSAVKSKKPTESSFMPQDLSMLSRSSVSTDKMPHRRQVPIGNTQIKNLSLTQYGNEVVAEEVLRQLLLTEQLADDITLSASKATAAKRAATVAAARAIAAGRAAAQAFMSASAALQDASMLSTASQGDVDVVNALVRDEHKRSAPTSGRAVSMDRSAFEDMAREGGIGPLHTSSW